MDIRGAGGGGGSIKKAGHTVLRASSQVKCSIRSTVSEAWPEDVLRAAKKIFGKVRQDRKLLRTEMGEMKKQGGH